MFVFFKYIFFIITQTRDTSISKGYSLCTVKMKCSGHGDEHACQSQRNSVRV